MTAELSVQVPRGVGAAALARSVVRARFRRELSVERLADLEVIISELTTNATVYGVGEIRLRVSVDGGHVFGEVIDQGCGFVHDVYDHGLDDIGKKGLLIVAALSEQWGIHDGSSHVWFELSAADRAATPDPELGVLRRPAELN